MTVEIYQRNLKDDSNYNLGENIKTQINNNSIIPILSDSIYKDPISAIRELYANEVTSCKLSKLKTRIEINLNSDNRELIIQGFNSMGITREIFEKILTVMGNSGNNNSSVSGLFGLGFFSHVKLSEKLICHSYSQTKERFSFISKSGLSFEILPDNLSEKLDQYGTKMILNVKDDIDLDKLINKIKQIIELSPIESKFILDNNDLGIKQFKSLKEKMKNDFKDILSVKYSTTSVKIYQNFNEVYDLILVEKFPTSYKENNNKCYLLNVPINIDLGEIIDNYAIRYCNVYLNIKDERDFLPHVSRDYLTSESETKLAKLIEMDLRNLTEYNPHFTLNDNNQISIIDYYNDNSRFFKLNSSTFNVKTLFNRKSEDFIKQFTKVINQLDPDYEIKGIVFLNSFNSQIMHKIYDLGYLSFVISLTKYCHTSPNELFYNITDIQDIFKMLNIKSKIGIKHIAKSNSRVFSRSDNPKYVFKIEDPKNNLSYSNNLIGFSYLTSKNINHYEISDIATILKDEIFLTNFGYVSIKDLVKEKCEIYFCSNGLLHNYIKNIKSEYLIIYSDNKLFCQLLSIYLNVDYSQTNLFLLYCRDYKFKNVNVKNLIFNNIINFTNIVDYNSLQNLLSLDYSFDMRVNQFENY